MVRRSATGLELVLHKGWTQTLHRPIHTDTRMIAASARSSAGSCWAIAVRKGTMPLVVVAGRAALALAMAAVWAGMAEARGAVAVEMKTVMGLARKLVAVAIAVELRGPGSYTGRSSFLGCFRHNTLGTNLAPVAEKTVLLAGGAATAAEAVLTVLMAAELGGPGSYTHRRSIRGCFLLHNTLGTNLAPVAEKTVLLAGGAATAAEAVLTVLMAAELGGPGSYTHRRSIRGCFLLHNTLGTNLAPVAEKTVSPSVAAVVMVEKLAHLEMAAVGAIRYRVAIGVAMAMAMAAAPTAWIQCCTSS